MKSETRERLSCFCEKTDQVKNGRFFTWLVQGSGVGFGFSMDPKTNHLSDMDFEGPDEEDFRALLLTVRMFCIRRDQISPESLEALAKNDLDLSSRWRHKLAATRAAVDQLMEDPITPEGMLPIPSPTCGDVFDIFLYGEYAHVVAAKRLQYQIWKKETYFPLLQFAFSSTVATFMCEVLSLASVTREEISIAAIPSGT